MRHDGSACETQGGDFVSRPRIEIFPAFQTKALPVAGGQTSFQTEFPLGEGWLGMLLRTQVAITIGTGTGALAQGMARYLTNVLIDTDRDGVIVNAPGRALFQRTIDLEGAIPQADVALAAASATYDLNLLIHFADPKLARPEDTILDTSRYNRVRMTISNGTLANLFSTPGTATIDSVSLSCELIRYRGVLPQTLRPEFLPYLVSLPTVTPANQTFMDIERSPDLFLKRLALFATATADAWQGNADDSTFNLLSINDQDGPCGWNQRLDQQVLAHNKGMYGLETAQAGRRVHDYVSGGFSILQSEFTGNKSKFRAEWTNDVSASKSVHGFMDAVKTLKPLPGAE